MGQNLKEEGKLNGSWVNNKLKGGHKILKRKYAKQGEHKGDCKGKNATTNGRGEIGLARCRGWI